MHKNMAVILPSLQHLNVLYWMKNCSVTVNDAIKIIFQFALQDVLITICSYKKNNMLNKILDFSWS